MRDIYPKGYWQKKYEEKSGWGKFLHGAKWALGQGLLLRWLWHLGILKIRVELIKLRTRLKRKKT